MSRCWGVHVSVIPETAQNIIDVQGRAWSRVGRRGWQLDGEGPPFHESWLLREHGPVRCPVIEEMLAERDEKLGAMLPVHVSGSGVLLPEWHEPVAYEDALMLMRAGWLAWPPKRRKDALASLRETEERELAVTS